MYLIFETGFPAAIKALWRPSPFHNKNTLYVKGGNGYEKFESKISGSSYGWSNDCLPTGISCRSFVV